MCFFLLSFLLVFQKSSSFCKENEIFENKKQKKTNKLDQFLTYKKGNLGPIFNFTAHIYIYIYLFISVFFVFRPASGSFGCVDGSLNGLSKTMTESGRLTRWRTWCNISMWAECSSNNTSQKGHADHILCVCGGGGEGLWEVLRDVWQQPCTNNSGLPNTKHKPMAMASQETPPRETS